MPCDGSLRTVKDSGSPSASVPERLTSTVVPCWPPGGKMVKSDYAPEARLAQHLKDVELILDLGGAAGADLPLSRLHRELLSQGVEEGLGELDNSSIIEVLRNRPSSEGGGE